MGLIIKSTKQMTLSFSCLWFTWHLEMIVVYQVFYINYWFLALNGEKMWQESFPVLYQLINSLLNECILTEGTWNIGVLYKHFSGFKSFHMGHSVCTGNWISRHSHSRIYRYPFYMRDIQISPTFIQILMTIRLSPQ